MNKPLRYIQVGTGGWGGWWVSKFLPRLTQLGKAVPAAAVDLSAENLKNAQQHLKLPPEKCYTDIKRAFAENKADFAIIVVPPAHHEAVVDIALAHNLHILSEKPIADSMEACVRIYHKVKKAGKKMAVTMSHRFDQDKQTLEREIKSGKYGRLNYLIGRNTWTCRQFASWGKFRHEMADTLLIEGTVHHFDIIRGLTSSNARTVYAVTWNPPWGEFAGDSNGLLTIQMENGVKVFYEGSKTSATQLNGWTQDYLRAECEQATLELDSRKLRVISDLSGERVITEKPLAEQAAWTNAWLAEMYCDWLSGSRENHPTNLDDNIQCCALLFAAIESAHTGQVVDVQEYLKRHLPMQPPTPDDGD
jgi:predicted dehydrogenase